MLPCGTPQLRVRADDSLPLPRVFNMQSCSERFRLSVKDAAFNLKATRVFHPSASLTLSSFFLCKPYSFLHISDGWNSFFCNCKKRLYLTIKNSGHCFC